MSQISNRTVLRAQTAIRAPGSSQCNLHREHDVAFVCKDCEGDLLCSQCVKQHQRHAIVNLTDERDQRKRIDYLKTFINQTEKDSLRKLQKEIEITKEEKVENSKHFKNLVLKVDKRSEEIKAWVDELKVGYIEALKEMEEYNRRKLDKYLSDLNKNLELVADCVKNSKDALQVGGPVQIYDTCTEIKSSDLTLPRVPGLKSADFAENKSNELLGQLREMLGSFTGEINITDGVKSDLPSPLTSGDSFTMPTPPASTPKTLDTGASKYPQPTSETSSTAPFKQNFGYQQNKRQQQLTEKNVQQNLRSKFQ